MKKNIKLNKINKVNNVTAKTLACHCGCNGKGLRAAGNGYIGSWY